MESELSKTLRVELMFCGVAGHSLNTQLNDYRQKPNLIEVSEAHQKLFIGGRNILKVFELLPNCTIKLCHDIEISQDPNSEINSLKVSSINDEEVLLVALSGKVLLFWVYDLFVPPTYYVNSESELLHNSIWNFCCKKSLLAAGLNSHKVAVWDLNSGRYNRMLLHEHSVSSVDISPCGKLLSSTSFDCTVVAVNEFGEVISCRPSVEWGWSVKWIKKSSVADYSHLGPSNMTNLRGRYSSEVYSTTYFNDRTTQETQRRLEGLPDFEEIISDGSYSEEDSFEVPDQTGSSTNDAFSEYFLVQSTKFSVHLIDPSINPKQQENSMHVLAVYLPNLDSSVFNFKRLSLLEYIEELSLVVLGNHGGKEVFLLRIGKAKKRDTECVSYPSLQFSYSFVCEKVIYLDSNLAGLVVSKDLQDSVVARVFCYTEEDKLFVYQVKKHKDALIYDISI